MNERRQPLDAGAEPTRSVPAVDLQEALCAWRALCDAAAAELGGHDLPAAEEALQKREALRPHLADLVGRLRARGGPGSDEMKEIQRLHRDAGDADARLVSALEGEQFRLRREIDNIGRPSTPASAYGRATEPSPHRLDIVR